MSAAKATAKSPPDAQGPQADKVADMTAEPPTSTAYPATPKELESFSSFSIFERCIERARNLVKIHEAAHGGKKAKPEKYLADAHRAAIVLSISALDAFVRSFVIERVRFLLADKAAKLPETLSARIKSFLKEDGLLESARKDDLLDRVEKAFR
jgi:hypothetical protein